MPMKSLDFELIHTHTVFVWLDGMSFYSPFNLILVLFSQKINNGRLRAIELSSGWKELRFKQDITLLHSKRSKLHTILAFLSAKGLKADC